MYFTLKLQLPFFARCSFSFIPLILLLRDEMNSSTMLASEQQNNRRQSFRLHVAGSDRAQRTAR